MKRKLEGEERKRKSEKGEGTKEGNREEEDKESPPKKVYIPPFLQFGFNQIFRFGFSCIGILVDMAAAEIFMALNPKLVLIRDDFPPVCCVYTRYYQPLSYT